MTSAQDFSQNLFLGSFPEGGIFAPPDQNRGYKRPDQNRVKQLEKGEIPADIAQQHGISKSMASKWYKDREGIYDAATDWHKKLFKKNRKST